MAMAFKAPPPTYKRQLYVGDHAVERLRDRIKKRGTKMREDEDLRNFIDLTVSDAIDEGSTEDYVDDGVPSILVDLNKTIHDDLWAIVRHNRQIATKESLPLVVVTLLEGWQVRQKRNSPKWEFPQYTETPDVMVGIPNEVLDEIRASRVKPQPVSPETPDIEPEKRAEHTQSSIEEDMILILYRTKEGKQELEEWKEPEKAETRLNELLTNMRVEVSSIRVFREVSTQIKLVL